MRSFLLLGLVLAMFTCLAIGPARAMADPYTWNAGTHGTGTGDGVTWNDSGNWTDGLGGGLDQYPGHDAGDTATIPSTGFDPTLSSALSGGPLTSLDVEPGVTLTIGSGGVLSVLGGSDNPGAGTIEVDTGGTLEGGESTVFAQSLDIEGGGFFGGSNAMPMEVDGLLTLNGIDNGSEGALDAAGTMTVTGTTETPPPVGLELQGSSHLGSGLTIDGSLQMDAGATLGGASALTVAGDLMTAGHGGTAATISAPVGVDSGCEVDVPSGDELDLTSFANGFVSVGAQLGGTTWDIGGTLAAPNTTAPTEDDATTVDLGSSSAFTFGGTDILASLTELGTGSDPSTIDVDYDSTGPGLGLASALAISAQSSLDLDGVDTIPASSTVSLTGSDETTNVARIGGTGTLTNAGRIDDAHGAFAGYGAISVAAFAANTGSIVLPNNGAAGAITISSADVTGLVSADGVLSGGTYDAESSKQLIFTTAPAIVEDDAALTAKGLVLSNTSHDVRVTLTRIDASASFTDATGLTVTDGETFTNDGQLTAAITQTGGSFEGTGTITGDVGVTGGTFQGGNDITGNLTVDEATLDLQSGGDTPAALTVSDTVVLGSQATVRAYYDSSSAISRLAGSSTVTVNPAATLILDDSGATAAPTAPFDVVTGTTSVSGPFASVQTDGHLSTWFVQSLTNGGKALTATPHVATAAAPTTAVAGSTVTVTGAGFADGETVDLAYSTSSNGRFALVPATTVADGSGTVSVALAVPAGAAAIDLTGETSGALVVASITMLDATTTTLAAVPATATLGSAVTLTATVTDTTRSGLVPAGTVTFFDGTTQLGTATLGASGTATLQTAALGAGAHSITAAYGGSASDGGSTSAAAAVTVNLPVIAPPPSPPTLTVTIGAVSRKLTLNAALAIGIAQKLHCNQACTVTSVLTIPARTAKALGLEGKRVKSNKAFVVGTVRLTTKGASSFTLKTRLTAKARRAFARLRSITFGQTIAITSSGGKSSTVRRIPLRAVVIRKKAKQ